MAKKIGRPRVKTQSPKYKRISISLDENDDEDKEIINFIESSSLSNRELFIRLCQYAMRDESILKNLLDNFQTELDKPSLEDEIAIYLSKTIDREQVLLKIIQQVVGEDFLDFLRGKEGEKEENLSQITQLNEDPLVEKNVEPKRERVRPKNKQMMNMISKNLPK